MATTSHNGRQPGTSPAPGRPPALAAARGAATGAARGDATGAARGAAGARGGERGGRRRRIGRWGTTARVVGGALLLADVAYGHWTRGLRPAAWLLGLAGFPGIVLAAQWLLVRSRPPLRATGPAGHALNAAVFLALYLTPFYAPVLSVTSDAALVFYGASMLFAAARGYAECEVLAVSNAVLRRDDQVGCLLFAAVDRAERGRRRPGNTATT